MLARRASTLLLTNQHPEVVEVSELNGLKNSSRTRSQLNQEKNSRERVTSTPVPSANATALGFSALTVTKSWPNLTVTMRAMKVTRVSTDLKVVVSTS